MPQRLPHVNGDDGTWGDILRQYLMKEHVNDDTDNPLNGAHKNVTILPGTAAPGTAPLKLTSGTLLSTPEAGAIEFAGDNLYFTQTSANARKKVLLYNDASGANGDMYVRGATGQIQRLPLGDSGAVLTAGASGPTWSPPASGGVSQQTRTGVYQFELCNNNVALGAAIGLTIRRNFTITQKVKRFRVHFINRNHMTDTNATGTLSGFRCYIGKAAVNEQGDINGAFTATPTQILPSTNMVNGTEVITDWIAPAAFTVQPYQQYLLSYSFTVGASDQIASGGGLQWITYSAADASSSVVVPERVDNQGFMGVYIEYEFENDSAPMLFVVGNSLSGGGNVVPPPNGKNRGELDAWQNQWALSVGGITASIAFGGGWAAQFGPSSQKWNHYNSLAAPLDPDMIVFMATSSSDIAGGDGSTGHIAMTKSNMIAAVEKARAMYPNAQILLTTNPPRIATSAGAVDNARLEFNTWLASSPMGALACLDLEPILTDGQVPARLHPDVDSGDHEHWSPRGHQRVSQLIPLRQRLPRP